MIVIPTCGYLGVALEQEMALEAFLDSNSQLPIPLIVPVNGGGGILEALSSHNSLINAEDLNSILGMAQVNTNLDPDVMNSTIVGKSSTSRSPVCHDAGVPVANLSLPTGPYLQSHGNTHMEPSICDNDISYWKKFVSEYYAPDSKKRWCFSTYENIDLQTGVFCPKSMILSWEFCAQSHEEYLLRRLVAPQIAEVVDSMKDLISFSHDTKMGPIECLNSYSQGSKIANWKETRGMEQFMGAQSLRTFPQQPHPRCHANGYHMTESDLMSGSGSSGLALYDLNDQLLRQNSSTPSMRRNGHGLDLTDHPNQAMVFAQSLNSHEQNSPVYILQGSQSSQHGKNPHQSLVDKLLQEMAAANREKSTQEPYGKLHNGHQSNQQRASNEMHYAESSNAAFAQVILPDACRAAANFSQTASHRNISRVGQNASVKAEPYSPEQPKAFQGSATSLSKFEDLQW
ncbi:UNVERIFIED_CONTAM: putative transcriptional regulator SLK2 [Sesamum angustifolium]|uniref:Transcriptional regulator SLK2 n=1 Tax=Sesamum angustifolium TaxID=2727405 RepID=A0AAW2MME1_9LAMI